MSQFEDIRPVDIREIIPNQPIVIPVKKQNEDYKLRVTAMDAAASLFVEVPGEQRLAPDFVKFPASLTVERGASASFEAELSAAPASVSWMKDGREVKEQPMKFRVTQSGAKVGHVLK